MLQLAGGQGPAPQPGRCLAAGRELIRQRPYLRRRVESGQRRLLGQPAEAGVQLGYQPFAQGAPPRRTGVMQRCQTRHGLLERPQPRSVALGVQARGGGGLHDRHLLAPRRRVRRRPPGREQPPRGRLPVLERRGRHRRVAAGPGDGDVVVVRPGGPRRLLGDKPQGGGDHLAPVGLAPRNRPLHDLAIDRRLRGNRHQRQQPGVKGPLVRERVGPQRGRLLGQGPADDMAILLGVVQIIREARDVGVLAQRDLQDPARRRRRGRGVPVRAGHKCGGHSGSPPCQQLRRGRATAPRPRPGGRARARSGCGQAPRVHARAPGAQIRSM